VAVLNRAAIALVALASVAHADEERRSLVLKSESEQWRESGFRLGLGLAVGRMVGIHGTPSGRLIGAVLHAGLRLDDDWSILATFQYAQARGGSRAGMPNDGLSGLRFAGTIDPTWHVTPSIALAVGFGFGGIVEGNTGRMDVDPLGSTLDSSYTFPSSNPPLPRCNGVGVATLARATWSHLIGPHSSLDVALEMIGQYTSCVDRTGRVEPDTAQPIERHQYWPQSGGDLTVGVSWR
jgi:hypothetical protein